VPQVTFELAHDRVEQKRTQLVAGTVGALLSRPKPEEIRLLSVENRLEPFWLISISARTVYDRRCNYTVAVGGPEVQKVTLLAQELTPQPASGKEGPRLALEAVEHCLETAKAMRTINAVSGERNDMSKYLTYAKTLIVDIEQFTPEGVLVVPPQVSANAIVRQVLTEVIKPVQNAQVIHEERVDVEALELNFRPMYAFEYEWTTKGKRMVIEFDPLTAETNTGGKELSEQVKSLKGMVTRDLLFDVTADAIGLIVPGGSIAVKLVKAVVDRGKR
jgi:hypothetical protein